MNRDVPDFALVTGVPARHVGWMSLHGEQLKMPLTGSGQAICPHTEVEYQLHDGVVVLKPT